VSSYDCVVQCVSVCVCVCSPVCHHVTVCSTVCLCVVRVSQCVCVVRVQSPADSAAVSLAALSDADSDQDLQLPSVTSALRLDEFTGKLVTSFASGIVHGIKAEAADT